EFFVLYKFFAFPVVDERRRVVGVVDVSLFAEEMLEAGDREERAHPVPAFSSDDIFEALGVRLAQLRGASPWRAFRYRFPWLLASRSQRRRCCGGQHRDVVIHGLFVWIQRAIASSSAETGS